MSQQWGSARANRIVLGIVFVALIVIVVVATVGRHRDQSPTWLFLMAVVVLLILGVFVYAKRAKK